ncbi:MAG: TrmJ/YjtD family RNA methyltransferase [Nitrospirae bacterium]|nr:TrmJ/YjtD family RNA methyltransferase [Nitrospirota bacterium]
MDIDLAHDDRARADPDWRRRVRIVLIRPEHAGNIGAAARAMKNMGFADLRLVAPACGHLTHDALTMAYGARDVLERARVHATLADATAEARWVVGFARPRIGRPVDGRLPDTGPGLGLRARTDDIALLFGSEISGLSNDDLAVCHQIIAIPTHASQPSLNLSQAVLLACYELVRVPAPDAAPPRALATAAEFDGLHAHLADALGAIGFLHPPHDRHLLRDLRGMINRAELDAREVRILRGILSQARWARERARGEASSEPAREPEQG